MVLIAKPPGGVVAGTAFGIEIDAQDGYGNTATSFSGPVNVALASGSNGTLTGTTTVPAVAGVAMFNNLVDTTSGSAAFTGTSSGLTAATTGNVTISPGATSYFVVTTNFPGSDVAGTTGSVTVTAYDANGNPVNSGPNQYEETVDLGRSRPKASGLPPSYTFVAGDDGSHSFSNVVLKTAGSQTIIATDSLTSSITGHDTINVVAAAANQVVFDQQPTNTAAGTAISPPVTVAVDDQYGNVVETDSSMVTLTLSTGSFDDGSATATVPASSGIATFDDLKIDIAGTYAVTASDAALASSGASNSVTISPAAASHLVLSGYPSPTTAGVAQKITVTAEDRYGNVATGYTGTIHFTSSDGHATVPGGLPSNYTFTTGTGGDDGKHSFTATLKTAGTQSISATDALNNTISGTQPDIIVTAAAATQLVVTTPPPNPLPAGQAFTMVVVAEDPFGNVVPSFTGNVTIALPGLETMVKAVDGVATFTGLSVGVSAQGGAIQVSSAKDWPRRYSRSSKLPHPPCRRRSFSNSLSPARN